MERAVADSDGHRNDADAQRQRKLRSWAIAAILLAMTGMFYAATIIRLGSNALNKAM